MELQSWFLLVDGTLSQIFPCVHISGVNRVPDISNPNTDEGQESNSIYKYLRLRLFKNPRLPQSDALSHMIPEARDPPSSSLTFSILTEM